MVEHTETVTVRRPVHDVFDFVVTRNYENHPRWEPEVLEIRPLEDSSLHIGSRAVMVRKDFGKVRETAHECVALEPDRLATFRHLDSPMAFEITFTFSPVAEGTRVRIDVRAGFRGGARLLTPLLWLRMPRTSRRLSQGMRDVVEAEVRAGRPIEAAVPA
jgi:hypothetical protein